VLKGDIAVEVSKLKQQPGKDIVIHGSPGLIRSLIPHDLIDEYRLLVYPIILGHGKRLFDETSRANLRLVESKTYDSGVVKLVYQRASKPATETVPKQK
jgi:dihydrofolate reductase